MTLIDFIKEHSDKVGYRLIFKRTWEQVDAVSTVCNEETHHCKRGKENYEFQR